MQVITTQSNALETIRHEVVGEIMRGYGATKRYAETLTATFGTDWYLFEHNDKTDAAKPTLAEGQAFRDELRKAGVDEIWCVSVNDAFVMGAWARDQKTGAKVRMLADGSADFTKATGLTLDLTSRGMGLRSNRYSMLVKDGKVATLNIEGPGKFEVSDAATLLAQAKA